MSKYAIIRAGINGGKTTTCGLLYEKLLKESEYSRLYNSRLKPISKLEYGDDGNLYDFVAILVMDGFVVIIISQGDVADDLEELLDKIERQISALCDNLYTNIDLFVCCGRSRMRRGSTIEMLYNRIESASRQEFWTQRSDKFEDRNKVKGEVIKEIVSYINTLKSMQATTGTVL